MLFLTYENNLLLAFITSGGTVDSTKDRNKFQTHIEILGHTLQCLEGAGCVEVHIAELRAKNLNASH